MKRKKSLDETEISPSDEVFENRLKSIRKKGLGEKNFSQIEEKTKNKRDFSLFSKILGDLVGSVVACVLIGLWLDRTFSTTPLWLFILTPMGLAAGIFSVYKLGKKNIEKN